jgi:hypothetical protein
MLKVNATTCHGTRGLRKFSRSGTSFSNIG